MKESDFLNDFLYKQLQKYLDRKAIVYLTDSRLENPPRKEWTYQELLKDVRKLKNILLPLRTKGSVIAVAVDEYPAYIIALLAIWDLGCIYMPLDPNKKEGIKTRLQLANAKVFIANKKFFHSFSAISNITYLEWEKITEEHRPEIKISSQEDDYKAYLTSQDTAYIYCSSGTSGEPKMIANTFEGLRGRVEETAKRLKMNHKSGILGYCSPDYDASLLDILMSLSTGACLYPVNKVAQTEVTRIKGIFKHASSTGFPITTMVVLPEVLIELKNVCDSLQSFKSLKKIITMGEECEIECLQNWFEANKTLEIFNGYGPTETTIAATVTKLNREAFNPFTDEETKDKIQNKLPMHDALPGVELYFLDQISTESAEILNVTKQDFGESNKKIVQIIIGGLGVGKYIQPATDDENKKAAEFMTELNAQHFISQNKEKRWYYQQELDNELKNIYIIDKDSLLKENHRYYLTGDQACITPIASEHKDKPYYDLQFLTRIDNAGKNHGVWTSYKDLKNLIEKNCNKLIQQVKIVSRKSGFAAFITPLPSAFNAGEEEFENKFFKSLYSSASTQDRNRLSPACYFLIKPANGVIDKVKSPQTLKALLNASRRWMVQRSKEKPAARNFNKIEQKIIKIWQSILFKDMENISDFKKYSSDDNYASFFTKKSHFLHLGGSSLQLMTMIGKVWGQDSELPRSFFNAVVRDPTLGNIADLINIYKTVNTVTHNETKEYPLIYKNNHHLKKIFPERDHCQIEINNYDSQLDQKTIAMAIAQKIRLIYPVGPYLVLMNKHDEGIMSQLTDHLKKSDLVKKFKLRPNNIEKIKIITSKLLELSCITKIKKWNQDDSKQSLTIFNADKFPSLSNKDTWYQSAAYTGKTQFLAAWRGQLWKQGKVWPIYINVEGHSEPNILDILFNKIGFLNNEIKYLESKKILFMIDHYDRMLRNDILDFRSNSNFKGWSNVTIWVISRYLQIEKLTQATYESKYKNIVLSNTNSVLANIIKNTQKIKNNKLIIFFEKYLKEEKLRHVKLNKININIPQLINFLRIFFQPHIDLNKICISNSPWEDYRSESDLRQFWRGHPYFIILRGLLSYKDNSREYFFKDKLIDLFDGSKILLPSHISIDEKKEAFKVTQIDEKNDQTLESLVSENPKSICHLTLQELRTPVIAFYPLTGEVPKHYFELFDNIGVFQPWFAFAMNIKTFAEVKAAETMDFMADYYANNLLKLSKYYHSYILLGWSFGALLAFKVAEKLEEFKIKVDLVINIDCPPPSYLKKISQISRAKSIILTLAEQKGYGLDQNEIKELKKIVNSSQNLIPKEFFNYVKAQLKMTSNRFSSFINMLKRAEINLNAYYHFNTEKKLTAPLIVAVASKRTKNLNDGAQYTDWEKNTSKLLIKKFDNDHFDLPSDHKLSIFLRENIQAVQPLINFTPFSQRLKKYYDSRIHPQQFFIELAGAEDETLTQRIPLLKLGNDFLTSVNKILLIYGPSGSGKTTLLMELMEQARKADTRVIYIKMNNNSACVKEEIIRSDFSLIEYETWKKTRSLIIMDGIENLTDRFDLWEKNNLDSWSDVKLILSSRYEASSRENNAHHQYLSEQKKDYRKIYCLPLSDIQINEYLTKAFINSNHLFEEFKKLHIHYYIKAIIHSPLILSMIVNLVKNFSINNIYENSRYSFYKYFFQQQIKLAENRLKYQNGVFAGTNLAEASWNYALTLAGESFNNSQFHERFSLECPATQQARMASSFLLVSNDGKSQFVHDSYWEFFYANLLWNFINEKTLLISQNNPWHQQPIFRNFSLLNFIVDRFNELTPQSRQEKSSFLIEMLKKELAGEFIIPNLISFLALAKQSFDDIKFFNASFKEANLTNAIFNYCVFDNIDFSQAIIHNTQFFSCTFSRMPVNNKKSGLDGQIQIKNCRSICTSNIHTKLIGYSTKKSFGIYDLDKNEFVFEKKLEKNSKSYFPIDFDSQKNLVSHTMDCSNNDKLIWDFIQYVSINPGAAGFAHLQELVTQTQIKSLLLTMDLFKQIITISKYINYSSTSADLIIKHEILSIGIRSELIWIYAKIPDFIHEFIKDLNSNDNFNQLKEITKKIQEILLYLTYKFLPFHLLKISHESLTTSIHKFILNEENSRKLKPPSGIIRQNFLENTDIRRLKDEKTFSLKEPENYTRPGFYTSTCGAGILFDKDDPQVDSFSNQNFILSGLENDMAISLVTFSNDSSFIAIILLRNQSSAIVYKTKTMNKIAELNVLIGNADIVDKIIGLAFNPAASMLAVASQNNLITIFNIQTQKIVALFHSRNELYQQMPTSADRTIHFLDNHTLLTVSDHGISVWNIASHLNDHLFDYKLPCFFSAMAFESPDEKHGLPGLYAGDIWGNFFQLDLDHGQMIKNIYQFQDQIVHKIAIAKDKRYCAVVTYCPSNHHKKLYILIDGYTKIGYEGVLSILPDAIDFDSNNFLYLSLKTISYIYQFVATSTSKLESRSFDKDLENQSSKEIPAKFRVFSKILFQNMDWNYCEPYLIFLGVNYNLTCCKLDKDKPRLLWTAGVIGNNLQPAFFSKPRLPKTSNISFRLSASPII